MADKEHSALTGKRDVAADEPEGKSAAASKPPPAKAPEPEPKSKPKTERRLVANVRIALPGAEDTPSVPTWVEAGDTFDAPDKAAYERALEHGYARKPDDEE